MNHFKTLLFFLILCTLLCIPAVSADATFHGDNARTGYTAEGITITHYADEFYNKDAMSGAISSGKKNQYAPYTTLTVSRGTSYFTLGDVVPKIDQQGKGTTYSNFYGIKVTQKGINISGSGAVDGSPVYHKGKVFFGTGPTQCQPNPTVPSDNMGIYCVDMIQKELVWNTTIPGGAVSGIAIADDKLYIGSISGKLYALNESTGEVLAETKVLDTSESTGLSSAPLVEDGVVYITSRSPAALHAFYAENLTELFSIPLNLETGIAAVAAFSSPSTSGNGIIYTAGLSGIAAVDIASQTVGWSFAADGPAGTPVYDNGSIYFETAAKLYSVNAESGTQNWVVDHPGNATAPAIHNGILVANGNAGLSGYNAETGELLWTHTPQVIDYTVPTGLSDAEYTVVSPNSPIIAGDMAYYTAYLLHKKNSWNDAYDGDIYTCLYGVDLSTGKSPGVTGAQSIASWNKNEMTVISDHTVRLLSGHPIRYSTPVVADNMIFVGTSSREDEWSKTFSDSLLVYGIPSRDLKTKALLPPVLTIPSGQIEGTAYTTAIGALDTVAGERGYTYQADGTALTEFNGIQNEDGGSTWHLSIDGTSVDDITTPVTDGSVVLFYYNTDTDPATAKASIEITVTVPESYATLIFNENYPRVFHPDSSAATVKAVVTDYQGKILSDAFLDWSVSGSIELVSSDSLTCTYQAAGTGGSGLITATYQPENAEEPIILESDPILIKTKAIPENPEIETTGTYTTWKGNYARTGVVNGTGPISSDILWDVEFPGQGTVVTLVDGSPVVYKDRVYFTTWDGGMSNSGLPTAMFCYNALTGEKIWQQDEIRTRTGLTIDPETDKIYASSGEGLACLNPDTGDVIWKTDNFCSYAYVGLSSIPLVWNNSVYVISTSVIGNSVSNVLYVFNVETGEMITQLSAMSDDGYGGGTGMFASPSMSPDGVIYVPGTGGVFAVDSNTNTKLWSFDAGARGPASASMGAYKIPGGNDIYAGSPVYKDQSVYLCINEKLYCLDAVTGTEKWNITDSDINAVTPVVTDDKVITTGGGMSAFDRFTGEKLWYHSSESENAAYRTSPIVAGDIAYYGTYAKGILFAVNTTTGEDVWKYTIPPVQEGSGWFSIIEATPAIENGILYIGAENGHFYAFKTPTLEGISFSAPAEITAGTKAVLTGSNTAGSTSASYSWDFGDGTKGTGAVVSKTWKTAGTYTVNVTAVLGDQSGVGSRTVTVKAAPAALTDPKQAGITVPDSVPDDRKPVLVFDTGDSSADTIAVNISAYETTAPAAFIPPNSAETVLYLTVDSVEGVTDKTSLKSYAKLTVNLSVGADTRSKLSFWRYADGLATGSLPQLLTHTVNETGDGWTTYDIQVPGFSAIVGSVNEADLPVINPPSDSGTGGGSSGGSDDTGLTYTEINPGTGTFKYTTNHPDWPVTDFTINKMTAFGVLHAAVPDIVTAKRWGGVYVHAIDGLAPANDQEGWMYQVNGISPGAMANNYQVKAGDKVVWYYSENMNEPVSKSKKVYAYTVTTGSSAGGSGSGSSGDSALAVVTASVSPASSSTVNLSLPAGAVITKSGDIQTIRIDTKEAAGRISISGRSVTVTAPGVLLTIPVTGVEWNGDIATATVRGMTAEIMPAAVKIPVAGTQL